MTLCDVAKSVLQCSSARKRVSLRNSIEKEHLSFRLRRNVIQSNGEYRGLSQQSTDRLGGTVSTWSDGGSLSILLAVL